MNKRKVIVVIGILFVCGILITYKIFNKPQLKNSIHYHAGFVVFDYGIKVDFSDLRYMNVEPCQLHDSDEKETPEHNQLEKAHLHDRIGDVVHVHVEGSVWGDLFTNIKYPLDYSNVTAYINGEKISDLKSYPIKANDSAVIFIGKVDEKLLNQAVTADHIKEVESKSETCGS